MGYNGAEQNERRKRFSLAKQKMRPWGRPGGVGFISDQSLSHSGVRSPESVGVVKWFNETKGFGFVTLKDGSSDILFT